MSMMNHPAVDPLIDTMNRQRSIDRFQTRFNVPFQSGVNFADTRLPGSAQTLDAVIQSMYLPATDQVDQRLSGMGISPLSMGTFII